MKTTQTAILDGSVVWHNKAVISLTERYQRDLRRIFRRPPRRPTARSIIDRLGGNEIVAKRLSVSGSVVGNWRGFNKFPAHTYVAMRTLLAEHGITDVPDAMWTMTELKDES